MDFHRWLKTQSQVNSGGPMAINEKGFPIPYGDLGPGIPIEDSGNVIIGSGPPSETLGEESNMYIDRLTGNIWRKE